MQKVKMTYIKYKKDKNKKENMQKSFLFNTLVVIIIISIITTTISAFFYLKSDKVYAKETDNIQYNTQDKDMQNNIENTGCKDAKNSLAKYYVFIKNEDYNNYMSLIDTDYIYKHYIESQDAYESYVKAIFEMYDLIDYDINIKDCKTNKSRAIIVYRLKIKLKQGKDYKDIDEMNAAVLKKTSNERWKIQLITGQDMLKSEDKSSDYFIFYHDEMKNKSSLEGMLKLLKIMLVLSIAIVIGTFALGVFFIAKGKKKKSIGKSNKKEKTLKKRSENKKGAKKKIQNHKYYYKKADKLSKKGKERIKREYDKAKRYIRKSAARSLKAINRTLKK